MKALSHLTSRRPNRSPREIRPEGLALIFSAPALVVISATILFPLGYAIFVSLHRYNLKRPNRPFVGFDNYIRQLTDYSFWSSLLTTAIFTVGAVATIVVLGLLVATLLDQDFPGRNILRALQLVPWAVPPVVNGLLWKWLLDPSYGVINAIFLPLGFIDRYQAWLTTMPSAMIWVIAAYAWTHVPLASLLLLAGLQTVPKELHEAAIVDGATVLQRWRNITLPLLTPTLMVVLIFETIFALKVFDIIYVLTAGGPGNATSVLGWSIYTTTFSKLDFGNGSALAILLGVITLGIAVLYFRVLNRVDHA